MKGYLPSHDTVLGVFRYSLKEPFFEAPGLVYDGDFTKVILLILTDFTAAQKIPVLE